MGFLLLLNLCFTSHCNARPPQATTWNPKPNINTIYVYIHLLYYIIILLSRQHQIRNSDSDRNIRVGIWCCRRHYHTHWKHAATESPTRRDLRFGPEMEPLCRTTVYICCEPCLLYRGILHHMLLWLYAIWWPKAFPSGPGLNFVWTWMWCVCPLNIVSIVWTRGEPRMCSGCWHNLCIFINVYAPGGPLRISAECHSHYVPSDVGFRPLTIRRRIVWTMLTNINEQRSKAHTAH